MVDADGASPRSRSIRFAVVTAVIPARKRASGDADGRSGEEDDGSTAVADAVKRSGDDGAPVQAEELRTGGDGLPLEGNAPPELSHIAEELRTDGDGWPLECDAPPELSHMAWTADARAKDVTMARSRTQETEERRARWRHVNTPAVEGDTHGGGAYAP